MNKILSIIIPTYNMEKYLRKCLDSLIVSDENMQLLEVLVINDGSKDSSSLIAHEYEEKYPQTFRVVDKENGHYGSCINRGLKEATGKYVRILDSDDSYDTKNLSAYITKIANINVDLIMSDFDVVNNDTVVKKYRYNLPHEILTDFSEMPPTIPMWMHAVAYRTEILKTMNYRQTEGISYTDQEWIFLPMSKVKSFWYFPHVVYKYSTGREGQTIDKEVFVKNIGQEVKGLFVMAEEYMQQIIPYSNPNIKYLQERLKYRMKAIYMSYLVRYSDKLPVSELQSVDTNLKEYPEIYKMTDEMIFHPKFPVRYVEFWHKRYIGNKLLFLILRYLEQFIEFKERIKAQKNEKQ